MEKHEKEIFNNTAVGVARLTTAGAWIEVNSRLCEITGYSSVELLERTSQEITHPDDHEAEQISVEQVLSGAETSYSIEKRYLQKEGTVAWVRVSASLIEETDGTPGYFSVVVEDISALHQAEADLALANQAKDEFLASMSHEMRAPLTVILGNIEHLLATPYHGGEDTIEALQGIQHAGMNQLSLVNDILDLSKIEAGALEINYAPFCLNELLQKLKQIFSIRQRETQITFVVDQEVKPIYHLWGDIKRIEQILNNLISNAFKFTEQGEITLRCRREGESLQISVEDSGIGMEPAVVKRLFKPFEQADSTLSRRFGGTGLGLFISQSLAELLDGSIEVRSRAGEGSCFTLTLPYAESDLVSAACSWKSSGEKTLSSDRFSGSVLIAEDMPEMQHLELRMLQSMGDMSIEIADNGKRAIEKARQQHFDLILMDMQMPVMNGLEATRQLKKLGCTTPIVALTANVMETHRDQFFGAGADDFLEKPIDKRLLQDVLKRFLPLDHSVTAPQAALEQQPHSTSDEVPILAIDDEATVLQTYDVIFGRDSRYCPLEAFTFLNITPSTPFGNFDLHKANQGVNGIELAERALQQGRPFPVAIIDMRMPPGISGLETAKGLRKIDQRIYIIFITAYSDVNPEIISRELGAGVLYLHKPFSKDEIKQAVIMTSQKWIKEYGTYPLDTLPEESTQPAAEHQPPAASAERRQHSVPHAQTGEQRAALAEDEVDDELMAIFFSSCTRYKEKLEDALRARRWKQMRETAHSIKGSAASFGYPELSKSAEQLQISIDEERINEALEQAMDLAIQMAKILP